MFLLYGHGFSLFCRNLIIILGVFVSLCDCQDLGIPGIIKDNVNILISAVTKQDANPDGKFDLVSDVRYFPVQDFLDAVRNPDRDLAVGYIFDQHIEGIRVKPGDGICGAQDFPEGRSYFLQNGFPLVSAWQASCFIPALNFE